MSHPWTGPPLREVAASSRNHLQHGRFGRELGQVALVLGHYCDAVGRSRSLYAIARPSVVCLSSVTFVRPTQAVQIFGHISRALGTLAIQ